MTRPVRLQAAARALLRHQPDLDQRISAMADTSVQEWTPHMAEAAAEILAGYPEQLRAAGIDLQLISQDHPDEDDGVPAVRAPAPFVYDQTIDGLRQIPVGELECLSGHEADQLAGYGLSNIYDLLHHVPLRYLDRSQVDRIADLQVGHTGTAIATVVSAESDTLRQGQRVARITVRDRSDSIRCTFFHMPWKANLFSAGEEVVVMGRLEEYVSPTSGRRFLQMTNPLLDRTGSHTAPIIPVYPQSEKAAVTTWQIHRAAMEAVDRIGDLVDPVPSEADGGPALMDRSRAYRLMHRPDQPGHELQARRRLAYDELLRLQLALQLRRQAERSRPGVSHPPVYRLTRQLVEGLPWPLTAAQQRVLRLIDHDLRAPTAMHRLLQGDVGSGKTVVAVMTMLMAVDGGHQTALMTPTEVLATQHHLELTERMAGLTHPDGRPVTVELLAGRAGSSRRRDLLQRLRDGQVDILVGTHALLADDVVFADLGVVVVDEQHRFGVEQRAQLTQRPDGRRPDVLVMTATPIPRTAAMTLFGDLDVAVLDALPAGRQPVATLWHETPSVMTDPDDPTWAHVRELVQEGRQAYVVCPLVEDSESKAAASAESTRAALAQGALAGLRLGLVHGKQPAQDRAETMAAFAAGHTQVLVATTVIEVGVNVPNAAVMVVLDPGSFGIAQLHQLRGRVGRGQHPSVCILSGPVSSADTRRRIEAILASGDGFELAEVDLELRGAGSILSTRQHGLTDLRVASLDTDAELLQQARDDAGRLLDRDPGLKGHQLLHAEVRHALGPAAERFLTAS